MLGNKAGRGEPARKEAVYMRRLVLVLTVALVMAATMVALVASPAVAKGPPNVVEGTLLPVPHACNPGKGGISGPAGTGVQTPSDVGIGATGCFVRLPEAAVGDGVVVL